ncbi:MAG: PEP-CTERM sorting domain-containing protein [Verrucomicrobiales bacterium]
MLKSLLTITLASLALAGVTVAGTIASDNLAGNFWEVQIDGAAVSGGFLGFGTTAMTDAQIRTSTAAEIEAAFTQFGGSGAFGNAAASNLGGFFSVEATGDGGAASFVDNNIFLIGGNGSSIGSSSHLFVIRSAITFAADEPLFAAQLNIESDTVILGLAQATGGTVIAGGPTFQMAAGIIPEPGVSILALFSAGLLVLRRRRR